MRRAVSVLVVLAAAACQAPGPSPTAPGARNPSHARADSTAPDSAGPVTLTGQLVDQGDWISGIGDAVPVGQAYNVAAQYVFVELDSSGQRVGVDSVASVDSVAYYNAPGPRDSAGALGPRDPSRDCPVAATQLVLQCPASASTAFLGQYLVTVRPRPVARATNPQVVGQFELYVYPP